MFTQKFKAKIYVEGSNFPIEVETEAANRQQAQKILESKYKIKKWFVHPVPATK